MSVMENPQLSETGRNSITEYSSTFDKTIELWATSMEVRDKEAKGHTLRVTEGAVNLAKLMGVDDHNLIHVRRGALLHDIGNMIVPESILHKKGELTINEWVVVHLHPFNAFEMLSPVDVLRPALDIPYYHHERWNGSGYPYGKKGEHVPLAARIFAVIDVADSLTSDRPFRSAWTREDTLNYIGDMSGILFDPRVVEMYMNVYGQDKLSQ